MTLQEQIFQASDNYEKSRWSHGVIDPVVLDEIGDAYFQGAEYGYKLAVDKACELLRTYLPSIYLTGMSSINEYQVVDLYVNTFKKDMEGGEND